MKRLKWPAIFGGLAVVAVIGLIGTGWKQNTGSIGPVTWQMINAGKLKQALAEYAQDHDNKFPASLKDLPSGAVPLSASRFHDPATKQASDWIYYAGYQRVSDYDDHSPSRIVILASPRMVANSKRIVIYADTSGAITDENDFALRLSRQLKDQAR